MFKKVEVITSKLNKSHEIAQSIDKFIENKGVKIVDVKIIHTETNIATFVFYNQKKLFNFKKRA